MLIEIIILLLAIPVGLLIAYLANDELVVGRNWFKALIVVCILVGIWFALTGNYVVTWACGFVVVVTFISLIKSFDKGWVRRRV
ncbi:MAG: hypothetical protein KJ718_03320 [Nanoarchaeota archaeon]|nr:hypothetical protein [Nanoarchaeota archaeon]MBU1051559.1 hypothetical protein [Nanoarchaeota archaeon]MBU1988737.1 hypothetical protein [Nanoarchaeota archaeon]